MLEKNIAILQSLHLRLIVLILITLILLTGNKFVNANEIPGLENFLDYAEAIYDNLYNPMKSGSQRTISWENHTSHPYAQEAIIMKLNSILTQKAKFTLAELNEYFDELITDTQMVQNALQKQDIDPAGLPELLNAYQLALMNKAEMELLPRILIGLILAKRPLKEIKLAMQFMQTRHEEFLLPFMIDPQGPRA